MENERPNGDDVNLREIRDAVKHADNTDHELDYSDENGSENEEESMKKNEHNTRRVYQSKEKEDEMQREGKKSIEKRSYRAPAKCVGCNSYNKLRSCERQLCSVCCNKSKEGPCEEHLRRSGEVMSSKDKKERVERTTVRTKVKGVDDREKGKVKMPWPGRSAAKPIQETVTDALPSRYHFPS